MPKLSYLESIRETLIDIMSDDPSVFLFGEGVDNITGVYGTTLPAYELFGPERVIDTPLSENALTGIAIGAALNERRPVLFHQRNDFIMLTMDQLVNHAAKIRYMSGGRLKVPMTIISFIARKIGEGCQHSQSLQALFAHIPGLKVVMPTNSQNVMSLLWSAIQDDDPVIVLFHRDLFDVVDNVSLLHYSPGIGLSHEIESGEDITMVSVSRSIIDCREAVNRVAGRVSVELIDLLSIRPYDKETILRSVSKTGRLLVVDTGWKSFGVGAEIVSFVTENAFSKLKAGPSVIALPDMPAPANKMVNEIYHPSTESIVKKILELCD
jgi:pyruvate dehydrogenase E1 component beta subunit